jgi:hypothetical protein
MALEVYTPKRRELILLYGAAGRSKTRSATCLTERFGDILYFAIDEGSEDLDSVLEKYRKRITVIPFSRSADPIVDAGMIASVNWKLRYPNVKTIIIDTLTTLSGIILTHATNKGLFQSKHNSIGVPGTDTYLALSDKGDVGGTHGILKNFITQIIAKQPDMNIIMICHEAIKENEHTGTLGGPATVGTALVDWLPTKFKTIIRLDVESENVVSGGAVVKKTKYVARTAPHDNWIARINENSETGNPMPKVVLNVDSRNLWETFDSNFLPKEEKVNV